MERKRTGLRIPYEQNTKLILMAQKIGVSKNALTLHSIKEYMERETNTQQPIHKTKH